MAPFFLNRNRQHMSRKAVPGDVQKNVLTRSRRRCCLCFWWDGIDEVKKGQIAHIDGDNTNAAEANLAFLCFDHHDDLDGTPRLAKGLRADEVVHWRDMLYQEMEYRFRTVQKFDFELRIVAFKYVGSDDEFKARFQLKNLSNSSVRSPVVAISLPDGVQGKCPREYHRSKLGNVSAAVPVFNPFGMDEKVQDLFEPGGRIGIIEMHPANPVLMADHTWDFDGLGLKLKVTKPGTDLTLKYRVDAENISVVVKSLVVKIPTTPEEFGIKLPDSANAPEVDEEDEDDDV